MNVEQILIIAGILLSLLFSYVPGFKSWFEPKSSVEKSLIMLGLVIAVCLVVFAISCSGLEAWVVCSARGAWDFFKLFCSTMVANQTTYLISPKRKSLSAAG